MDATATGPGTGFDRWSAAGLAIGAALLATVALACDGSVDTSPATATLEATPGVGDTVSPAAIGTIEATATDLPSEPPAATPASSENVLATPRPTATPNLSPRIVSFSVPAQIDCTASQFSGTIHLAWWIVHATGVTLSIRASGSSRSYSGKTGNANVPFDCARDNSYLLVTTGGAGPAAKATRHAKAFAPEIELFSVSPASCDPTDPNGSVQVSFKVAYATGVTLYRGDTEQDATTFYTTFPVKEYLEFEATFPCPKPEHWYRLTTSGGYGVPASADRQAINNASY